ncbi:oligosaccharide flippase family protein [Ornithinimicrobium sp. W1665]|uniref:oligosaccharide flippase family protein n=1 Tax=Ornithinimicrobium sp. W1665 TaxID=3416666 RepID=UPI003CE6CEBF
MTAASPLSPRDLQQRAVSGAAWTLLHTLVSLPLAFAVNVALARVLGVADYGRLALLTAVIAIASSIVSSGVGSALTQFGAKAHAAGRRREVQDLLARNQGFRLMIVAPFLTATVILFVDLPLTLMVVALFFGVWLPAFSAGGPAGLTLENRTAAGARLAMLTALLMQLSAILVLVVAPSAERVWAARTVVGGVLAFVALWLISRDYRKAAISPRWPFALPRRFWSFALPASASGIIAALAASRSETVLLEILSDSTQLGLYALAFGLAGHLFAPAQALLNPLIPAVSGLREVEPVAVGPAFGRTLRTTSTIGGLVLAGGAPVLALLVPAIYGEAYAGARALVLALAVVAGINLLTAPMEAFTSARLRGKSLLAMNASTLLFGVAIGILLIPSFGAWGAVWAKLAITVGRLVFFVIFERMSFGVGFVQLILAATPVLLSSVAGIAGYALARTLMMAWNVESLLGVLGLAAGVGAIASALFVASLWVFRSGLTSGDAQVISRQGGSRLGRPLAMSLRLVSHAQDLREAGPQRSR